MQLEYLTYFASALSIMDSAAEFDPAGERSTRLGRATRVG